MMEQMRQAAARVARGRQAQEQVHTVDESTGAAPTRDLPRQPPMIADAAANMVLTIQSADAAIMLEDGGILPVPEELQEKDIFAILSIDGEWSLLEYMNGKGVSDMCGGDESKSGAVALLAGAWADEDRTGLRALKDVLEETALLAATRIASVGDAMMQVNYSAPTGKVTAELAYLLVTTVGFKSMLVPTTSIKKSLAYLRRILDGIKMREKLRAGRDSRIPILAEAAPDPGDNTAVARCTKADEKSAERLVESSGCLKPNPSPSAVSAILKVLGENGSTVSRNMVSAVSRELTERMVVEDPDESLLRDFLVGKFVNAAAMLNTARKLLELPERASKHDLLKFDKLVTALLGARMEYFRAIEGAGQQLLSEADWHKCNGAEDKLLKIWASECNDKLKIVKAHLATGTLPTVVEASPRSADLKRNHFLVHGGLGTAMKAMVAEDAARAAKESRYESGGDYDGYGYGGGGGRTDFGNGHDGGGGGFGGHSRADGYGGKGGYGADGFGGKGRGAGKGFGMGKGFGAGTGPGAGRGGYTGPCYELLQKGVCEWSQRYGNCKFAHVSADGKSFCRDFFLRGSCSKAAACELAHS